MVFKGTSRRFVLENSALRFGTDVDIDSEFSIPCEGEPLIRL